ncbi:inverse autotransporter beta domain-containing protein [Xenorhabdus sp. IM139775]|uniref:inverse autotransporter beta domain-containing protein n=1 Tax=Xenorhabdus sp. IM139775 TaxID=3025876 RepID=UPI00235960C6|nr:inverse autotransporter beta domain-containing protein [Xenorhabdus sp. IM139775]MDC9594918.1 inverse autotransporter beta domain-containing protein [Xenorhabdus sp. IM139775]
MSPYIGKKFIRFLPYIGSLFLPFVAINTLAIGEKNTEQQTQNVANEKWLDKSDNRGEDNKVDETAGLIAQNVQTVAQVLSSSPSQLTEQAKSYATSYALGKVNSALFGETQKWLSQFGTARINFALDRKGKLDNGSLDLLLPLYDNKADWLTFSQFGYRHKDSRHTLNVGLGGRYFTPDWMYGLNSFFDHDVTGKNQRLGVGGEAWTDYVKLSANTYWRLSKWRQSQDEHDWEERPASGFDLLGEFYLPAYPNLGGKLGFEQYYGDNVVLFNRDSKQKDPSLGRVGLNYTPVPLLTMGVDYKYGGSGHSETLFQANLNYRFGIPFDAQFSPGSVASARTLAGSRYDLVERNNYIVLDHRKKEAEKELQLTLPQGAVVGYSRQSWPTPIPVAANVESRVKRVIWQADEPFTQNGGSLAGDNKHLNLILPNFVLNAQNTHAVNIFAEDHNGKLTKPVTLSVTVQPLDVKQFKAENIPTSADGKESYQLLATLAQGAAGAPISDTEFKDAVWSLEPQNDGVNLTWETPSKTNDKGQLQATVSSAQPLKDINVFLELPGMAKKHLGDVSFGRLLSDFNIQSVKSPIRGSFFTGNSGYTFTALVTNKQGEPLRNQKVDVKWYPDKLPDGVILSPMQGITNDQGQLFATLTSTKPAKDINVGASIDGGQTITHVANPVTFINNINAGDMKASVTAPVPEKGFYFTGTSGYTFTTVITDKKNKPLQDQPVDIKFYPEPLPDGVQWLPVKNTTDAQGQVYATLISSKAANFALTGVSVDGGKTKTAINIPVIFVDADKAKDPEVASVKSSPTSPIFIKGEYTFTAAVIDKLGQKVSDKKVEGVKWLPEQLPDGVTWSFKGETTDKDGNLTATLTSTQPTVNDINVAVSVDNGKSSTPIGAVAFEPAIVLKEIPSKQTSPQTVKNGSYTFTVVAYNNITHQPLPPGQEVGIEWYPDSLPAGVTWSSKDKKTRAGGELTATLTSDEEAQIVVAASVYGKDEKFKTYFNNKTPVAFINGITVLSIEREEKGKVLAGGKGYSVKIKLGDKGSAYLPLQTIDPALAVKFEPVLAVGGGTSSATLEYSLPLKTDKDGIINATLIDKVPEDVKIEAKVGGSVAKTSDVMTFVGDIDLETIEIENKPNNDQPSDGKKGYHYQVIVKSGNDAVENLNLENDYDIEWSALHDGNGYDYKSLVGSDLKFSGQNSTTTSGTTKGALTATLTSSVGLNGVKPTLTLKPKLGHLNTKVAQISGTPSVNFAPIPNGDTRQKVGLRVTDPNGSTAPKLYGNNQPVTILDKMHAELWDVTGQGQQLFDAAGKSVMLSGSGPNYTQFIKPANEKFQFTVMPNAQAGGQTTPLMTLDPTTFNMTVTDNKTGIISFYTYKMEPKQIFVNLRDVYNIASNAVSPWGDCVTTHDKLDEPLYKDIWNPADRNALVALYSDLPKWTMMKGATQVRIGSNAGSRLGEYSLAIAGTDAGSTDDYAALGKDYDIKDAYLCMVTK